MVCLKAVALQQKLSNYERVSALLGLFSEDKTSERLRLIASGVLITARSLGLS